MVLLHGFGTTPRPKSLAALDDRYLRNSLRQHLRCHADVDVLVRASFATWQWGALPGPMLASRLWTVYGGDDADRMMFYAAKTKTTAGAAAAGAKREKCIPHITVRPLGAVWPGLAGSWSALCGRFCLPCRSPPLAGWFLRTRSGPARRSPGSELEN